VGVLPNENPSGVVYGVILIGALLAAESGRHEGYPDAIGSAVLAIALYWLAHAYASVLGQRLSSGARLSAGALARALAHDWALVRGAGIPLIALGAAWAAGADREAGVTAALWSAIGSLLVFELVAGVRSRATAVELVLDASVGAAMGMAILALKIILH
jgi:hypothetical protein